MSLCPEAAERAAMSDDEFWAHVLEPLQPPGEDVYDLPRESADLGPCPECGELGACAYDAEGRPMVHVREDDSDD